MAGRRMGFSGIALLVSAAVVALTAELTARGKVSVNGGAGIRIRSVMASQEAWVKGHTADMALLVGMLVALGDVVVAGVVAHRAASEVTEA